MNYFIKGYNKTVGEFFLFPLLPDSRKDYDIYKSFLTNKKLMKTSSLFNRRLPKTDKEVKKLFLLKTQSWKFHNIGYFKIMKKDGVIMGVGGCVVLNAASDTPPTDIELGLFLKKEFQNRGLSYQIMKKSLEYLFNFKNLKKAVITCLEDHYVSQIVATKLHFDYTGILEKDKKRVMVFSLNRDKYFSTRSEKNSINSYIGTISDLHKKTKKLYSSPQVLSGQTNH